MGKTKKQRQAQEQKLLDAVSLAASLLKEAGSPLHGLGPNQEYANDFDRYAQRLRELVAFECPLHVADWSWNGYEGRFDFYWEFSVALAQPGAAYEHDVRHVSSRCLAQLDPEKPLLEELTRLRAEAAHYDALRGAMMRWASDVRRKSLAVTEARTDARVTVVCADCDLEQCACPPRATAKEQAS